MNSEKRRTVFFRAFWRIVILLFVMIPLLWGVRTSLCASNYDKNLIPKEFTLDNYSNLLKSPSFLPGIWNSIMVSLCTILILLPIVTLASYALGRMKFKGRFLEKSASPFASASGNRNLDPLGTKYERHRTL